MMSPCNQGRHYVGSTTSVKIIKNQLYSFLQLINYISYIEIYQKLHSGKEDLCKPMADSSNAHKMYAACFASIKYRT